MIRRSFRAGLALGLLAGLVFALVKTLGGRNSHETAAPSGPTQASKPWPKLEQDPTVPAAPRADLVRDPAAPPPAERARPAVEPTGPSVSRPPTQPASQAPVPPAQPAESRPVEPAPAAKAAPARKAAVAKKATTKSSPTKKAATAKKPAKKATKAGKATKKAVARAWVEPSGDTCPTSHPVKAKLSSKIFHLPGMLNYERTNPDRCYQDAPAAEADGLRAAKR